MRVAVVGGGIQGAGIALELSLRGVSVDLYEKRSACLTQASLRNEGKIHLGFVYAKDATLATARAMASGAAHFEPTLTRWLERDVRCAAVASPFYYYVHRDSLLTPSELSAYYSIVTGMHKELSAIRRTSYFGADATQPAVRLTRHPEELANRDRITAVFQTPEIAVDTEIVAGLLAQRVLDDPRISLHANTAVTHLSHDMHSATLTATLPDGVFSRTYDHVINASWEDLLTLDNIAGVPPLGAWSFRVKHFLRLRNLGPVSGICSATVVLGAFGDVVQYAGGDVFLSWYPVGRTGISFVRTPPSWPSTLLGAKAAEVRTATFEAMSEIMPALRSLRPGLEQADVNGGIIFAWGDTDVHDPDSRLHERHSVGPRSFGRYHSVNTGKYTLAPMFTRQMADFIVPASRPMVSCLTT